MKKERIYTLTLQRLSEYQDAALQNAIELVEEAQSLLEGKHFARTYYLALAALEESGKAFQAFLAKGRNLEDPGVQKAIKAGFEDHRSKILSSLTCLLQETSKSRDQIERFIQMAYGLEVGRERAMYVDLNDAGTLILPRNGITETNAAECLRLAKTALHATMEYMSTKPAVVRSPFEDKLFCIKPEKLMKIMNLPDFGVYLLDFPVDASSIPDVGKALVKYHDEFFSRGKLYSKRNSKPEKI